MVRDTSESSAGRVLPVVMGVVVVVLLVVGAAAYLQARFRYENPGMSSDSALARQIFAFKDAIWPRLDAVRFSGAQAVRDAFVAGELVGGTRWDGTTDPAALQLSDGGIVSYDYLEAPHRVTIMITSGPRPDGAPAPMFADYGWYVCAVLTFEVSDEPPEYDWQRMQVPTSLADTECEPELVATLHSGYALQPISDFSG